MSARLLSDACDAPAPFGSLAAKLLLIKLVDCCDDEGRNIWPSRAVLARAACCSDRTVRHIMGRFCAIGLLRRVVEGGKGPGSVNHYEMDVSMLKAAKAAGWPEEAETASAMHATHDGDGDQAGETAETEANKGELSSPLAEPRGNWDAAKGEVAEHPNPLEDKPSVERESAGARRQGEGTGLRAGPMTHAHSAGPAAEPDGMAAGAGPPPGTPTLAEFRAKWPSTVADSAERVANAWALLDFGERRAAVDGIRPFLDKVKALGRTKSTGGAAYLAERRWLHIAAEIAAKREAEGFGTVKVWGRDWWAILFDRIRRGQSAALMLSMAAQGKQDWHVRLAEMPSAASREGLKGYRADSPEARAALAWLAASGAKRPEVGAGQWLWLPPDVISDGQRHVEREDAALAQLAARRAARERGDDAPGGPSGGRF